jgi:hypothetical protein
MYRSADARARPLRAAVAFAFFLFLGAVACAKGEEEGTPQSGATQSRPTGSGSATLEVGGRSYLFDRVLCAFGPEETKREDTEFVLSAIKDGVQLDATISTRFGHVVTLADIRNSENPSVGWSAGEVERVTGGAGEFIRLDGKRVSATAQFTDRIAGVTEEGTLSAACP